MFMTSTRATARRASYGARTTLYLLAGMLFLFAFAACEMMVDDKKGGNDGTDNGNQPPPSVTATAAVETHTGTEANAFTVRAAEGEDNALTVDLSADPVMGTGGSFADDTFVNIRNLVGGNGVNTFTGNAEANSFTGGTAADVFMGKGGNDILYGKAGADTLNGGAGNDVIVVIGTNGTSYTAADLTIAAARLSSRTADLNLATSLGLTAALINSAASATSDVAAGEGIDGGEGMDDLIVYGDVDMTTTRTSIAGISTVVLNSSIRMKADQLTGLTFKGAGANSTLIIASGNADFSGISDIDGVVTIRIEAGATLTVAMAEIAEFTEADDAIALEGAGTLAFEEDIPEGELAGVSIAGTLTATDNGTPLDGDEMNTLGTNSVDSYAATADNDVFVLSAGADTATGFTSVAATDGHRDLISFSGFATTNIADISLTAPNANSIQLSGYGEGNTFTFPYANIADVTSLAEFETTISATRAGAARFFTGLVYTGQGTDVADTLTGTTGNDTFYGFGGNDTFIATIGNDSYYGGDGNNTLSFAGQTTGIIVNLDTENSYNSTITVGSGILITTADDDGNFFVPKADAVSGIAAGKIANSDRAGAGIIGTVSIRNIDNLVGGGSGSSDIDILVGDDNANRLDAGANSGGNGDILQGNGGADTFVFSSTTAATARVNITDFDVDEGDMLDLSAFTGIAEDDLMAIPSLSVLAIAFPFGGSTTNSHVIYFPDRAVANNTEAMTAFNSIKGNIIYAPADD